MTEQSYIKYHHTPLLPSIKDKVTNPVHSVEGVASEGWVRGGVPSRELTRDDDYYNKHTIKQYI